MNDTIALTDAVDIHTARARRKAGAKLSMSQALDFQMQLHAFAMKQGVKPLELAGCARAWCDLEERKRILRGKPLPGALRPVAPAPKVKPNHTGMAD
jgi:hypothetical protein